MVEHARYREWLARQRLTRRRLLRSTAVGGAVLAAATLVDCSNAKPKFTAATGFATSARAPSPQTAGGQPKRGGTLVHLSGEPGSFPSGFDPHKSGGSETGPMSLFYQGLVRLNPNPLQVEPEIGQKWEQPTPSEYFFHLAPGIKWHNKPPVNGRPLVAADVAFSLNRARTNDPAFVNRGLLVSADKIEPVDAATLHITTKQPDATALVNLADVTMLILAPEAVEKFGKLSEPQQAIGTGAFVLQSQDGSGALTVRNTDYWKPGLPYVDAVKLVAIQEEGAQWAAFLNGQIDVVSVPGSEAKGALVAQGKKFNVGVAQGSITNMIHANTTRKPFDDARVPRALRLLVDHGQTASNWLDTWFGAGNSLTLPHVLDAWDLAPDEYATKLEWKQPKDDAIKEALSLLAAAGFTKDNPLSFEQLSVNNSYDAAAATLMQDQWRRLSQGVVQTHIRVEDTDASRATQSKAQFDVSGPLARSGAFEPDQILKNFYRTGGSANFGRYSDTKLDQLIDAQSGIIDVVQRKAAIKDIVRFIVDQAPYTNFASHSRLNAWQLRAHNVVPETGRPHLWQYEHVWLGA